ncbi:hypothetical protein H0H93_003045 [Arthromyces matolae]|nr:hypothetical protein H0H93_003045 [Arthromyces matolae]
MDVNRLLEYNPGLNCSSLEAGKEFEPFVHNTQTFANDTDTERGKPLGDIFEAFPLVEGVELAPDESFKEAPLYWDAPTPVEGDSCVAYGIRNYISRIRGVSGRKNWESACKKTKILFCLLNTYINPVDSQCKNNGISGELTVVMPNNAAAWQNGHGEGPTADFIANDHRVREAFQVCNHLFILNKFGLISLLDRPDCLGCVISERPYVTEQLPSRSNWNWLNG